MAQWTVDTPLRLDAFLARNEALHSRSAVRRAIEAGEVTVDGVVQTKPSAMLKVGSIVECDLSVPEPAYEVEPHAMNFPIAYEDDACFVIDKPAGIAVHPGSGIDVHEPTLLHGLKHLFDERGIPFHPSSILVHRLDRDTTGCLLIAKHPAAHAALQKQFKDRTVSKKYRALVHGVPSPASALIDAPIGRDPMQRTMMTVKRPVLPRDARTKYDVLSTNADHSASLLECLLLTGRTHQIRVHLTSIKHPILGDGTYNTKQSMEFSDQHDIDQLCLHAHTLEFDSPATKERCKVTIEAPGHFMESMKRCAIQH